MTFSRTSRRRALKLGLAASLAAPAIVRAQAWPSGPIVFLNPFPAGGGTDTFCRPAGGAGGRPAWPADHCRQQGRCRRHGGRVAGRQGQAGRLAVLRRRRARHHRAHRLQAPGLRSREVVRADHHDRAGAPGHLGQPRPPAGEDRGGVPRLRAEEPRQGELRLVRAPARRTISRANCSSSRPGPSSCTCPIVAPGPPCRTCSPAMST